MLHRYAFGQTVEDYEQSIQVNYMGTVNTLFYTVPSMIKRNRVEVVLWFHLKGEIYLVGSTCSMLSYIGYAAYAPSKYAIKGLADGLRIELKRNNIHAVLEEGERNQAGRRRLRRVQAGESLLSGVDCQASRSSHQACM